MAASVLQAERHLLLLGSGRNRPLLRMLPPRVLFPHRRRSWPRAVRVSPGDGEGAGGFASAVEKRSIPGIVEEEGYGARGEELEGDVAGALEQRWPPWDGLAERYKLIGATSLAFVICNMDKVTHPVCLYHVDGSVLGTWHGMTGWQAANCTVTILLYGILSC
jgi:MFS transporter, ACS family, solute carrier family 17 (sodium-dependent inorganic phosphate cotransporter), other